MDDRKEDTPESLFLSFKKACDDSLAVYFSAWRLYNAPPPDFSPAMRDMLVEYIILRLFAKWELLLENLCIAYMLGHPGMSGATPTRYAYPVDRSHALDLIRNGNRYPDWTDIETILRYARMFFKDGGPFRILSTMKADVKEIKKVRNAVAHASGKAAEEFAALVRSRMGYLPEGMSPAIFLCSKRGKRKVDPTYCEYYIQSLCGAAEILADYALSESPGTPFGNTENPAPE